MFIIGQDVEIWVEHCPSRVLTSCTVVIAILTVFIIRIGAGSWSLIQKVVLAQKGERWRRFLVHVEVLGRPRLNP